MSNCSYYIVMKIGDANKLSLLDRAYRAATNNKKFFNNGVGDKLYLESLFAQVDNIPLPQKVEISFEKPKSISAFKQQKRLSSLHKKIFSPPNQELLISKLFFLKTLINLHLLFSTCLGQVILVLKEEVFFTSL